ncbi:MAG: hypothetical protein CMK59_13210 [Proteobacteria bacterium]|nr:hypothetical protein [Pseudomonadota bacterium]
MKRSYFKVLLVIVGVVLLWLFCICSVPILDEGTYLWVSKDLTVFDPYGWSLPFPPWGDAYMFAHPPLHWMWLSVVGQLTQSIWWTKVIAGAFWMILLGGASWRFIEMLPEADFKSWMIWLLTPIVLMPATRPAMPDLQMTALGTCAMLLFYREHVSQELRIRGYLLSGFVLGLASLTKYPALLLWVPILMFCRQLKSLGYVFAGFALSWGLGEGLLFAMYDRVHLFEVLRSAGDVPRGPLLDRFVGLLLRLGVGAPLLLFATFNRRWITGAVLGVILALFCVPDGMSVVQQMYVLIILILSCGAVVSLLCQRSFFSVWALVVWVGVVVAHNYASPRYLMLSVLPMVLLLEKRSYIGIVLGGLWSLVLIGAEHAYAQSASRVAQDVVEHQPEGGFFIGEWSFRWVLESQGWKPVRNQSLDLETTARAKNAASGPPLESEHTAHFIAGDFPVRLVDGESDVGYYSDTLGFWPLGWGTTPLEEAWVH